MFCVPSTVTRVVRVISQLRGNMLLVGVGGSGRQSLSKMAAFICEYQVFQVEVTKQYRKQEFREGEIKHREHDCIQCLRFVGLGIKTMMEMKSQLLMNYLCFCQFLSSLQLHCNRCLFCPGFQTSSGCTVWPVWTTSPRSSCSMTPRL